MRRMCMGLFRGLSAVTLLAILAVPLTGRAAPRAETFDLVIYGGTSAAATAAVQARRMKKTAVIIEPGTHLGGLTSGGLGATDIGNKGAIGGLSRSFYEQLATHYAKPESWKQETRDAYFTRSDRNNNKKPDPIAEKTGRPTMWTFEPGVAERILRDMVSQAKVPIHFGERLDLKKGVEKRGAKIVAIRMESGRVYRGKMFMDATYEGDLMALAGVSFHVGREANSVYGETLNGVQVKNAKQHNFTKRVDPYRVPGDPKSGLLPGVHDGPPGEEGSGDKRVQAYNFRMTLTDAPENRLPIPRPADYDPMRYELLRRYIDAGVFDAINLNTAMPNRKTDINNQGAVSSDHIGANYDWPEGDYATRARIFKDHVSYVMGMWWFLQNDPRLPARVREKAGKWGLCKDEFLDTGHWSFQLYVREGRRMISDYVMTEADCRWTRKAEDSVGLAAYTMDSHNVQRYVKDGAAVNEGDVQVKVAGPYAISYRSIIPKKKEAENLLVPVAMSASHIAYGSIRMEPVFMVLGQSAATAAALALDSKKGLHDLPYAKLRERLLADGQVLSWEAPATAAAPAAPVPAAAK
jgi:hypothetical protein